MGKRIAGILVFFLLVFASASGQYSQYMVNGLVINPAYAGSRGVLSLSGSYVKTWAGIPGAPSTQLLSVHSPLTSDKIGLGAIIGNRKIGAVQTLFGSFDYSFRIHMRKSVFSMGLRATAESKTENFNGLNFVSGDPALVNKSVFQPNFGFGLYYYGSRFFTGFSVPRMVVYGIPGDTLSNRMSFHPKNYHYMATAGVLVGKGGLKWEPTLLLQYFAAQKDYRLDINSIFIFFDDKIWLGASYRKGASSIADQIIGLIEIKATEQFMIGYSYDYSIGQLASVLGGSHEIFIRFEPIHIIKAINPRYF